MSLKHQIRKIFWKFGYEIVEFTSRTHPIARRKQIFKAGDIDTVIDIGANAGQFAQHLRKDIGYTKKILSFEPLSSAFELLKANSNTDSKWEVFNFALGDIAEKRAINIANNSCSSSFLEMLPSHLKAAPESKYSGRELIEIRTLDSLFNDLCLPTNNVYLKIDTQGFENKILIGAKKSLAQIGTIQLEMSLVPLYKGSILFDDMCRLMESRGYRLIDIETGFSDQITGRLLQVDGIFQSNRIYGK